MVVCKEAAFNGLQVFLWAYSQGITTKVCGGWPDSVWLGIPHANQESSRIKWLNYLVKNTIMLRPVVGDFQDCRPRQIMICMVLVVDKSTLTDMGVWSMA